MNNWYEALEVCSDFIEAWLCYHFIGIFLPDRVRGRLPFFLLSMTLVCSVKAMNASVDGRRMECAAGTFP